MGLQGELRVADKYQRTDAGMLDGVAKLWRIFDAGEKRRLIMLLVLILSLAFVELVGVGSIMPFLAVAAQPSLVETNRYLAAVYTWFNFERPEQLLVLLGGVVVFFVILQNAFTAFVKYAKSRFSNMRGHTLSLRLFEKYLSQPYVFFLNNNSSELAKNVLGEVKQVITGYLQPLLNALTDIVVSAAIGVLLIAVNPVVAVVVFLSIGLLYGLIYVAVRRRLSRLGRVRLDANRVRYQSTMEAMAGIKDVKLLGKERFFLERYGRPSKKMARASTGIDVIGNVPGYVSDAMVYGGIVSAITVMMALGADVATYVPVLGVYILAGKRLMPKIKELYANISKVRAYQPVVDLMFEHLEYRVTQQIPDRSAIDITPLPFERELRLDTVSFIYPQADATVIDRLNMSIPKNTTVGFVGATGCGKTTLVDIMLGLLPITEGQLLIDDVPITDENLRAWQANLGYVPQHIYLTDDTITRNIAFGIPDNRIDKEAVQKAARIANIAEFIDNELPGGYDGTIGERGLRLSGGQRQRLGIARALYTDPSVLVMDEATSALDGMTEAAIMEAMEKLTGTKTIILIAHRLATLKKADVIYMFNKGRIVAQGSYEGLMASNEAFQQMARVSE